MSCQLSFAGLHLLLVGHAMSQKYFLCGSLHETNAKMLLLCRYVCVQYDRDLLFTIDCFTAMNAKEWIIYCIVATVKGTQYYVEIS